MDFENEDLQNIIIFYEFSNIKTKYPLKLIKNTLNNHQKMFINYTTMCRYYIELIDNNNEITTIIINIDPKYDIKSDIKITVENLNAKYLRTVILVIFTSNSIKDYNPIYYIKKIPKPMFIYTILILIDNNLYTFKNYCENYNNPISSYIKYKLFNYIDQPIIGKREIFYN